LDGCHCNFCGFKKHHYYSPILNRTITLLQITEIYHFIRFECCWADLQCIVCLYRPEYPSILLSVHVTNVWTTHVLPRSFPHLPHERWHGLAPRVPPLVVSPMLLSNHSTRLPLVNPTLLDNLVFLSVRMTAPCPCRAVSGLRFYS
jgi:hypothetical protein